MLQISDSVGSAQNGSITAVLGSGITSMSLAWIGCQPRIDDPSNPKPSSNTASSISLGGTVKCCQIPRKSLNLKSIATAFCSFMNFSTSFGVMPSLLLVANDAVDGLFSAGAGLWLRTFTRACARAFAGFFLLAGTLAAGFFLDGIRASFTRTDADDILDRNDEDFSVTDAPGLRRLGNRLDDRGDRLVFRDDFKLHLGQEIDDVLGAAVQLCVSLLPTKPFDFTDRDALDADVAQTLLDLVELERLDDGFDLFHGASSACFDET